MFSLTTTGVSGSRRAPVDVARDPDRRHVEHLPEALEHLAAALLRQVVRPQLDRSPLDVPDEDVRRCGRGSPRAARRRGRCAAGCSARRAGTAPPRAPAAPRGAGRGSRRCRARPRRESRGVARASASAGRARRRAGRAGGSRPVAAVSQGVAPPARTTPGGRARVARARTPGTRGSGSGTPRG